ncbi:GNAT family N-acetyltransferase [Jeotgalicoccus halotolerans]|uniref:RimJ/RimL family protein N-acetyltransferase n=1 Tax=Jeotgalicoccus halotolerans TaxID=157227 RepID=A0A3E0AWS6_9STAP|nr:GNAT family N-acetyltransferase [Jeotgalicoccus halotolerans]REG24216.1 RimJ/RimL family protein N-acetyltransferase [Jeotgalicoccus halotolerans]
MDISIREFTEADRKHLENYILSERQRAYSSMPLEVLDDALNDINRTANVVVTSDGKTVGFFVLHKHYQHEGYSTPHEVVYVRSLSINEKYQGNGYGTAVAQNLPVYVQENFSSFDHLFLVVDGENAGAWNLYERAGFLHLATKEEGPIGKERLYYLDLNRSYVPNLKLEFDEDTTIPKVKILLKQGDGEVGYIDAEQNGSTLEIKHIFVDEEHRSEGVAESAMRQFATAVRKRLGTVDTASVTVSEPAFEKLFMNAGFAPGDDGGNMNRYVKLIRY